MVKTEVEIAVTTTGTEDAKDNIKSVGKEAEKSTEGVDAAVGLLDEATGGLASRVKNVGSSIVTMGKGAVKAFRAAIVGANGMKKALISTGIGALVVGVGMLIAYWDDLVDLVTGGTEEMSEAQKEYNTALAGAQGTAEANEVSLRLYLSAVNDVTKAEEDRLFALNKLKEAGIATEDIDLANAESLGLLNQRVEQNIQLTLARAQANAAAQYLEKEMIKLYELEAQQAEERTEAFETAALMQQNLLVGGLAEYKLNKFLGDQNEERIKAEANILRAKESYKEALEALTPLEGQNLKQQEDIRVELERRAKTDSAVAQALKDREAAEKRAAGIYAQVVKDLEALRAEEGEREIVRIKQNYEERIALLTAQYGAESEELKNLMILRDAEIQAIEDAQQLAKEEKDKQNREARAALLAEIATAEANTQAEIHAKQLADTAKYYDSLIQQAKDAGIDIVELEKSKAEKLKEIQDNADKQAIADKQATNEALATTVTDSLTALANLTGENTKYTKAVSAAAAIINTYTGASKALAQGGIAGPIAAAGVIATGLATVRSIYATDVPSPPSGGGGGSSTPMPSALRPLLNFGGQGLNSGIGLDQAPNLANQITQSLQGSPIKAYVVSQEVQTQAKMNRKIRETATIG
jgi:hypothetical protein